MFMFAHVMRVDGYRDAPKTSYVFKKARNTHGCIRQTDYNKTEKFLHNHLFAYQFKIKFKQKSQKCQV